MARLTVDERIATGSWEMQGLSLSKYKSLRVWGALQLTLDDDGFGLHGMWVGFGSELKVQAGSWEVLSIENVQSIILRPRELLRSTVVDVVNIKYE